MPESASPRTRGGWVPTGTSAARRKAPAVTAKAARTEADLVAAARRVFERIGYLDANVSDIVGEANVARGSFYTYFGSKLAIFKRIQEDVHRQFTEAIAPEPGSADADPYGALFRSNVRFLEMYRANGAIIALVEQLSTIDPEMHQQRLDGRQRQIERVARLIRKWQRQGVADPDVETKTTAAALVAMLSNFAYWEVATEGAPTGDIAAARTLTDIWARAVGLRGTTD